MYINRSSTCNDAIFSVLPSLIPSILGLAVIAQVKDDGLTARLKSKGNPGHPCLVQFCQMLYENPLRIYKQGCPVSEPQ